MTSPRDERGEPTLKKGAVAAVATEAHAGRAQETQAMPPLAFTPHEPPDTPLRHEPCHAALVAGGQLVRAVRPQTTELADVEGCGSAAVPVQTHTERVATRHRGQPWLQREGTGGREGREREESGRCGLGSL